MLTNIGLLRLRSTDWKSSLMFGQMLAKCSYMYICTCGCPSCTHTCTKNALIIVLLTSFICIVSVSDIYGGHLLGVKSVSGLAFFDWESTDLVRRIEIQPKSVSCLIIQIQLTAKYAHCIKICHMLFCCFLEMNNIHVHACRQVCISP